MASPLTDILNAQVRQALYVGYAVIGVALTATQAGYGAATNHGSPDWLTVAFAVYGVLGTGLGLTAASNINRAIDGPERDGLAENGPGL